MRSLLCSRAALAQGWEATNVRRETFSMVGLENVKEPLRGRKTDPALRDIGSQLGARRGTICPTNRSHWESVD